MSPARAADVLRANPAGYCRARLAAFKVPKSYRVMAELPRLSSGDRQARAETRTARHTVTACRAVRLPAMAG